jgi:NADH-quinone oxidoreductase E subunit
MTLERMQKLDPTARDLAFSPEAEREVREVISRYPDRRAALLPVLWIAEREFGYIDRSALDRVAETMELDHAFVLGTFSFYTMYRTVSTGRHHLQVCRNIACWLRGHQGIVDHLEKKLGIEVGETTDDGRYTLSLAECLGSCGTAPMMQIDDDYHENLTPERVDEILSEIEKADEREGSGKGAKKPGGKRGGKPGAKRGAKPGAEAGPAKGS